MKLLILSDIHGNLSALNAVMEDAYEKALSDGKDFDGIILLGDSIDYGMRSNEVVEKLALMDIPIICSVWGNHEAAILESNFDCFSSERGKKCAQNTAKHLDDFSRAWLMDSSDPSGKSIMKIEGFHVLFVHGNIEDPFWGTITPSQEDYSAYSDFDIVISGHSHIPHIFTALVHDENPKMRNKKAIVFINPGSVGQPRNHIPRASYAIWDTSNSVQLNTARYDIKFEQSLYDGSVDMFYRDRLENGI